MWEKWKIIPNTIVIALKQIIIGNLVDKSMKAKSLRLYEPLEKSLQDVVIFWIMDAKLSQICVTVWHVASS